MESNEAGYRTLGWIINKSEQGLFLVVADERVQKEIVDVYRRGSAAIKPAVLPLCLPVLIIGGIRGLIPFWSCKNGLPAGLKRR